MVFASLARPSVLRTPSILNGAAVNMPAAAREPVAFCASCVCTGRGGGNGMAKKQAANRRGLLTERDLMMEVSSVLEAANWTVLDQARLQRPQRFGGDILASRVELGQERRYAIDCILKASSEKVRERFNAFRNYTRQSKQPFAEFDEFWIVGYEVDDPMRRNPENDRHFRVLSLDQLRKLLQTPRPRRPRNGATTKIGKAIEANEKAIILAIEALKLQIDDKLTKLRDERPNDPDAVARKDAAISEFDTLNAELERIKVAVHQLKKKAVPEKEVVKAAKGFKESVGDWWHKSKDTILSSTSNSAIFISAAGLMHTMGIDSGPALGIVGTLIGGDTVVKALKAMPRTLFKIER
jgi:hypothetical protein